MSADEARDAWLDAMNRRDLCAIRLADAALDGALPATLEKAREAYRAARAECEAATDAYLSS